ncbi:hypothetical protein CUJ83_00865 [Methanocella sp. CWC-04]|uniref:PAS domain-containing protein n=1 Tax=Methanooceanicella nereidis TaxID=2052831 RepID=A0AAP2W4R7_9EURY|nr:GAF domain-containing protein [Methanocella sp. CWC-04]MCD1293547.1 hypothetical protein [Methanocella sp. CWC-04]
MRYEFLKKEKKTGENDLEKKLRECEVSEKKYEAIIRNMVDGLCVTDLAGNIIFMNPAALRMHGFKSMEESRRALKDYRNLFDVNYPDGSPVPFEDWPSSRAMRGETFSNQVLRVSRHYSDAGFTGSYSGSPVLDEKGVMISSMVLIRDITAAVTPIEKKAKGLKKVVSKELHELARAISDTYPYMMGADVSMIILYDEDSKMFKLLSAAGTEESALKGLELKLYRDDRRKMFAQKVMETGKPIMIEETHNFPMSGTDREIINKLQIRSIAVLPMIFEDRFVGTLSFGYARFAHTFTEQDINTMSRLADEAATMVGNTRID